MSCFCCRGELGGNKVWKICYSTIYDKCRGKTCPDCGKVRKVVKIEAIYTENFQFFSPCGKCGRINNYWVDKLCTTCFLKRERKRGCVCFFDSDYNKSMCYHTSTDYYCSLCDESHPCREALCKKCFEKQTGSYQREPEDIIKEAELDSNNADISYRKQIGRQNFQFFLKIVLLTTVISLIFGFFLRRLFRKIVKQK